jgi:GDP-4-dehydro-6-deoxy-D-mannose reductase
VSDAVLVTGAAGFAGGHLVQHLAARSFDVVGWSRREPPPDLPAGARWRQIDLLDRDEVRSAVQALRPRAVYHCAGVTHVEASREEPARALSGNVLATHYVLDALRRADIDCRLLVTGSAAIYAPSSTPLTEEGRVAPDSLYAVSKLAQEQLALRAVTEDGLDVVVARAFNHTGPRQSPTFVTASIARQIALIERGLLEPVLRLGNLDAARDLTDVRDVVRAYVALMESGASGGVYNVASGVARTIRSVVDRLVELAHVSVRVEVDPERLRPTDKPVLVGDPTKLQALTGWTAGIPFDKTLGDLLEYWRRSEPSGLSGPAQADQRRLPSVERGS